MIKNTIILRYLVKENIFSFLIIFSFSCLLFISIDLIELIRRSSSKEIEFLILFKMAIFHIPTLFPLILPTVFLLSSMHTFMKLNKNNELTVLRASGFSIWSLILPAIFNVVLISFLYLLVFNPIWISLKSSFVIFKFYIRLKQLFFRLLFSFQNRSLSCFGKRNCFQMANSQFEYALLGFVCMFTPAFVEMLCLPCDNRWSI